MLLPKGHALLDLDNARQLGHPGAFGLETGLDWTGLDWTGLD